MKLFIIALLFTIVNCSSAGEMVGIFTDPDYPNKCVYEHLVLSPGAEGQPKGKCVRFMCYREDGFSKVQSCGVEGTAGPDCKLGDYIDPDGAYPKCCSRHHICD